MFAKVINPKTDGKGRYDNSGSSAPVVNYLSKEDIGKGPDRELYFSHNRNAVTSVEVIKAIDTNAPKIGKTEAKFYSLVIAPTPEEMQHLKNDREKIKAITRDFMDIYASNFNGKNGKSKNLKGGDLVYFAKLEENRYYKGNDIEVKEGRAKQGDPLPGDNTHIHIIVSRMDKKKTIKLSPLANDKKLFWRGDFKKKCCKHFDERYNYKGSGKELDRHQVMTKGTLEERKAYILKEYQEHKTLREEKEKQQEMGVNTGLRQGQKVPEQEKEQEQEKAQEPQKRKNRVFEYLANLIHSLLHRKREKSKEQKPAKQQEQKQAITTEKQQAPDEKDKQQHPAKQQGQEKEHKQESSINIGNQQKAPKVEDEDEEKK